MRPLRHELGGWLDRVGASNEQRDAVTLAIHEAVANAIGHANGRVTVRGVRDEEKLLLVVSNTGRWKGSRPSDRGLGGLTLMRALMSNLEIHVEPERTIVRMRLDFSPGEQPAHLSFSRAIEA